ncbi:MAG TPA: alpha/beta hydrolase [Bryobacteraceae bacterium]
MKHPLLGISTMVVLVPLAAVVALPIVRYFQTGGETLTLDDAARRNVPGSFVRLRDGVTHYESAGPAGGTAVLLIPGFSTPYNIWDPTFDGLAKAGFHVVRFEFFGRGWSDRPDAKYDADFYDRQVTDLLDALSLRTVDVAGASMGGPIAVTFANRHPDRVRRVMLFDPGYWEDKPLPVGLRLPVIGTYNMAVVIAPGLPESQWADFAHPERYPHYLDPYREQMRYRGFRRALLETLRNYISHDVTGEYRQLGKSGKPVLLVWGKADQDTPFELSNKVRADVPQAQFHAIDDAAHIPHYEHPELVNPMVIDFLR